MYVHMTLRIQQFLIELEVKMIRELERTGLQELEAITDSLGKFKVGPLRNFDGFVYSAEKEGYIVSPIENKPGFFKALKLSELTIQVVDSEQTPLNGVLLSVSGGANYRSNNFTKDTGEINFVGLSPGEYFIRPVLKEYSFEPSTVMVTVKEGSLETVKLVGQRVAFRKPYNDGCRRSVNVVLAETTETLTEIDKNFNSGDLSNEDGEYRVRGLNPGCNYQLGLKNDPETPGTIPNQFMVQVVDKDIRDKNFILKPQITTMELAGRIVTEQEYLSSLKVVIAREDQPDSPTHTIQMQHAASFHILNIPIDDAIYIVRLESSLSKTQFKHMSMPWATFKANSSLHFIKFEFNPSKKAMEAEISKSGYIVLPLAIIIGILVYNQAKVLPIVQDAAQQIVSMVSSLLAGRHVVTGESSQDSTNRREGIN